MSVETQFRRKLRRRLFLEGLERRAMLAGDVFASVSGSGNLTITGDSDDNSIEITQLTATSFSITGLDGTLINGESDIEVDVSGNVTIDLRNGDDTVAITGATDLDFDDNLTIKTGNGLDVVTLTDVTVDNNLKIDTCLLYTSPSPRDS